MANAEEWFILGVVFFMLIAALFIARALNENEPWNP